jgi:hypothetical protein
LDDFDLNGAATAAIGRDVALVFINAGMLIFHCKHHVSIPNIVGSRSDSGEDYITVDGNEGDR